MTWALISSGALQVATQTFDTEPTDNPDHLDIVDVSAYPGFAVGWVRNTDGTYSPPSPPIAVLAQLLYSAASAACDAVTQQIVPDTTHQNAYVLAASLVGPTAAVPTVDPAKTYFANMAAANGFQPQAFASLVAAIQLAGMQLQTILAAVGAAAKGAVGPTDLATALTAFQANLVAFVTAINGQGLTVTVTAPPAIVIPGINA